MIGRMEEVREGEMSRGEREVRDDRGATTEGIGEPLSKGSVQGGVETKIERGEEKQRERNEQKEKE